MLKLEIVRAEGSRLLDKIFLVRLSPEKYNWCHTGSPFLNSS